MDDYIARAVTLDGYVRIFAAKTTDLVNEAVKIHHCAPTAAAALGRALTAAALMGATLKDEESSITLQIDGGGPIGKICAITDKNCYVRGYCDDPTVDLPLKKDGKLDVGKAVGTNGYLNVIRDYGLKKPYIGRAELVSGEIGEDLTRYYAISEQVPSAVGLGVLVDTDYTIKAAGGFIVQLMPGATENHIADIEKALSEIPSVTKMIEMGMKPEDIAEKL
ncbi:MAG: Hsp33 family molecular chaperone HslO, partial [Bacillota bacterium]|nr:Hsp33 family molecular chaperone HslO [Bacillota bacterium]